MNQLTIIEYSQDGYQRIDQRNELEFYKNLEPALFKFFQGNGDVKTFGFILNNDKNRYFQELISDEDFRKKLNEIIGSDLTLIWCEPNSENRNSSNNSFEYVGKITGPNPRRFWNALSERLVDGEIINDDDVEDLFPILYLLKIKQVGEGADKDFIVVDSFFHILKKYDDFDNVMKFKTQFLNLIKEIHYNLSLVSDGSLSKSEVEFKKYEKIVKKIIVIHILKTAAKKTYGKFGDFLKDILENIFL